MTTRIAVISQEIQLASQIPDFELIPIPFQEDHLQKYDLRDFAALVIPVGPNWPVMQGIETAPLPVLALPESKPLDSLRYSLQLFDGVVTDRLSDLHLADDAIFLPLGADSLQCQDDRGISGEGLSEPTVFLTGHPAKKEIRWWGEMLQSGFEYDLNIVQDDVIQPGMLTIDLGGAAFRVLERGGILLQPPDGINLPEFFRPGVDYWRWEAGQLLSLLSTLKAQGSELLKTAGSIRQRFYEWRRNQIAESTKRLFHIIHGFNAGSNKNKETVRGNQFALAQWCWLTNQPQLWDRAGELLKNCTDNPGIDSFNQGVIGLRKWLSRPMQENHCVYTESEESFQSASRWINHPVLILYQSLLLASVQMWCEEREFLLTAFMNLPSLDGVRPEWLLLPEYGMSGAVNYRKELWESLGYCWEKLGYNGLACICFERALREEEDALLWSKLGLGRLQAGDRDAATRDLSIACGRGCPIPEVWEIWVRQLWNSGEIKAARLGLKSGRLLMELMRLPFEKLQELDRVLD